jgi:hypothetical protein
MFGCDSVALPRHLVSEIEMRRVIGYSGER